MELDMTLLRYQVGADDCMWQKELHCSLRGKDTREQFKSILISNSKISFFFDKSSNQFRWDFLL